MFRPIKQCSSQIIYQSRWMKLRVDNVELSSGEQSQYGVVEKNDFVLVIPVMKDLVMLVTQYRYPIDTWTWEFPQGSINHNESIDVAARRELLEETGCIAKQLQTLGYSFEAPAFATEGFHIIIAQVERMITPKPETTETGIRGKWYNYNDLNSLVRAGSVQDAATLAALYLFSLSNQ